LNKPCAAAWVEVWGFIRRHRPGYGITLPGGGVKGKLLAENRAAGDRGMTGNGSCQAAFLWIFQPSAQGRRERFRDGGHPGQ